MKHAISSAGEAYPQISRDDAKAFSIRVLNMAVSNNSGDSFNPYPEPSNAISHIDVGSYSIENGVLIWEGKEDPDLRGGKITVTADLHTGKGTLTKVADVDWNKRQIKSFATAEMNCRIESPIIDMKF